MDSLGGHSDSREGFHTKGYIFNMTQAALTKNKEWNTRIVSTAEGEYAKSYKWDNYRVFLRWN